MALLAGTTLFAACKGPGSGLSADSAKVGSKIDSVKLVKTAEMRFKVKDVRRTSEQISKLTVVCGGTVMHHNMQANIVGKQDIELGNDSIKKLTLYNTTAEMVLKIPSESVELFMDSINNLGNFVDDSKMDVEDHTLDYMVNKLKASNRKASVALRSKIKLTQHVADSILQLKDDMVDRKISNLRTDDAVKYSVLNLSLYQNNTISKEVVANDDLSGYNSPLSVRLGAAISKGWFFFSELVVAALHLWAFILIGGVVWFSINLYKRKKRAITERGT